VATEAWPPQQHEHDGGDPHADEHGPGGPRVVEQRACEGGSELNRADRDGD
jgi:hypothetical protein